MVRGNRGNRYITRVSSGAAFFATLGVATAALLAASAVAGPVLAETLNLSCTNPNHANYINYFSVDLASGDLRSDLLDPRTGSLTGNYTRVLRATITPTAITFADSWASGTINRVTGIFTDTSAVAQDSPWTCSATGNWLPPPPAVKF